MAKQSKIHPSHKTRYRVTNWRSYDRALVGHGSLTVWLSAEAINAWTPESTGQRGGQPRYSDVAIQTALHLRLLLRLPWRQTEGLLRSLMELMGLSLEVPDHTTLSRRSRDLAAELAHPPSPTGIHLVVDASGLKVFGQGQWAAARSGSRSLGPGWRKLHLAVDETGCIIAAHLTDHGVADASVLPTLLERIERRVVRLTADGAYDRREVYEAAGHRGATVVVPPQRGARISHDPVFQLRNRHIRRIRRVGRAQWRREKKQHRQARAENAFYRYKRYFGSALRARDPMAQTTEMIAACSLLNWMTALGAPRSEKRAA